jgi:hypothetical protein
MIVRRAGYQLDPCSFATVECYSGVGLCHNACSRMDTLEEFKFTIQYNNSLLRPGLSLKGTVANYIVPSYISGHDLLKAYTKDMRAVYCRAIDIAPVDLLLFSSAQLLEGIGNENLS